MAAYLLAWNPKRWQWDDLAKMSQAVKAGQKVSTRWGCGRSRRLQKGDRAFFIRLGTKPKGIFASGTIVEGPYEDIHWEADKAAAGETVLCVDVQFDVLLDPEHDTLLPRELLDTPPFSGMHWDTKVSGIRIPDAIAAELEAVWENFGHKSLPSIREDGERS